MAQNYCPSGINIHVNSGTNFIWVWSPLSGGDYHITQGHNTGTHVGRDIYSLDLNMAGTSDLGKAVFLPFTARVWAANTSGPYGKTVMAWDPGSGILFRLAHLDQFASTVIYSQGGWIGAGTKVGYIGGSGGWSPHLHATAYRNVKTGVAYNGRAATEADIIGFVSTGTTPTFAQAQKFRIVAPGDNCDLVKFDDSPAIYSFKFGILHPINIDAWRSMGLSVNLAPTLGSYDSSARSIPMRTLPSWQRPSYSISSQLMNPRTESVFKGRSNPAVYVLRWGRKNLLNANQFGPEEWREFHWSEVQIMDQTYVNRIP